MDYKKIKLKDGSIRYVFDVSLGIVDGKRKRTTVRAKTVKEGREKVARLRTTVFPSHDILFKDACRLYLTKSTNSQLTDSRKRMFFARMDSINNIPLSKLDSQTVSALLSKGNYKPSTYNLYHGYFSSLFSWCVKEGYLTDNPLTGDRKLKVRHKEVEIVTECDFWKAYQYLGERYKLPCIILMYCGLRKSELCGLSRNDFDGKNLHLSHTVKYIDKEFVISPDFKTSTSRRIVPVPSWVAYDLDEVFKTTRYPFARLYNTIHDAWKRALVKSGLPHTKLHALRHSYCSLLLSRGIDIFTVSRMLGHTSTTVTERIYAHLYDTSRDKVRSALESNWS